MRLSSRSWGAVFGMVGILPTTYLFSSPADSLADVFPLRPALRYSYQFTDTSYFDDNIAYGYATRKGQIDYHILDSAAIDDSTVVWAVLEIRNYTAHWTNAPPIGPGLDSIFDVVDTVSLQLTECLNGRHELKCNGVLWEFPLRHFHRQVFEPVYRYGDSANVKLSWSWLNPPGHDGYGGGSDTIAMSNALGFSRRSFKEWWMSGLMQGYSLSEGRALTPPSDVQLGGEGMPGKHFLLQNYPNPFNPSTTIKYELPKSSDVRLGVYDMLGREVSVLVNERKDAGVHEVKLDGSNLASGVYFYRLQAGDFVQTRKLLLLR